MTAIAEHEMHEVLNALDAELATMAGQAATAGAPAQAVQGWGTLVAKRDLALEILRGMR